MNKSLPKPKGQEVVIFKGKLIEIVQQKMQAGDKEFTVEFARRSPGTRLIIISRDHKILLTKEYRTDIKKWDIRLPGGKVVDTLEEYNQLLKNKVDIAKKAMAAAKKEALEEVGLEVEKIKLFALSNCGTTVVWDIYYFIVTKFHNHPDGQRLELGENIKLNWVSFNDAKKMCLNSRIGEDRSVAVLLRFLAL